MMLKGSRHNLRRDDRDALARVRREDELDRERRTRPPSAGGRTMRVTGVRPSEIYS
jgi:hypothetical protein